MGTGRRQIEQPVAAEAMTEKLAKKLECDGRKQEDDLPVHFEPPEQLPQPARQAGEHERGEVPDRFLRTELAQAAAGEAAADGEGEGDELAREERRQRD